MPLLLSAALLDSYLYKVLTIATGIHKGAPPGEFFPPPPCVSFGRVWDDAARAPVGIAVEV